MFIYTYPVLSWIKLILFSGSSTIFEFSAYVFFLAGTWVTMYTFVFSLTQTINLQCFEIFIVISKFYILNKNDSVLIVLLQDCVILCLLVSYPNFISTLIYVQIRIGPYTKVCILYFEKSDWYHMCQPGWNPESFSKSSLKIGFWIRIRNKPK